MLSSSGGVPHHLGLRVNVIRFAPRSRLEMMNGPADGPGSVELSLVERFGGGCRALRQQHGVAGEHAPPFGVGLANVTTAWRSSTPRSTFSTRSAPLVAAIANPLSLPLVALIWDCDVLPRDRGAVAPHRLRVDGVGDHLRVGAGQLDVGEVVGVDGGRAVGGDPERARHRRPQHARDVGRRCRRCAAS